MDARRLTAPLVAAGLLRRRPAAPSPDAVRDTLADARQRALPIDAGDSGTFDLVLCLPAGAGPHPVALLVADGTPATPESLTAGGVAAVSVPGDPSDAALGAIAAALAGRIDVNPHEIGVIARTDRCTRLTARDHMAFTVDADAADPVGLVLSRVTIHA